MSRLHFTEFISSSLSKEGEEVLYQTLGILAPDEPISNLPDHIMENDRLLNSKRLSTMSVDDYYAHLPTNVPGVNITVIHGKTDKYHGKKRTELINYTTGILSLSKSFIKELVEFDKRKK